MFAIMLSFQSRCDKLRRFLVETRGGLPHTQEIDERKMTKWKRVMCGQIISKYSLVSDHILTPVKEREKRKMMNIAFIIIKN